MIFPEKYQKVHLSEAELTEQGFNEWWGSYLKRRFLCEGGITHEVKNACYLAWHTAINHHKHISS